MSLFDHHLIVVHGKGGVGRTTMTAALALAAARSGRQTAAVEVQGQHALARLAGLPEPRYDATTVAEDLDVMSLSLPSCLSDFGKRKLRIDALARWFFESRVMTGFIEAVPGLADVIQLGKVENMLMEPLPGETVYDLAVLDAPATGHGLTLLSSARTMGEMTRVGPFYDLARIIEDFLEDPTKTQHVLTVLPEPLPVQEGLELAAMLAEQGAAPRAVLANQVLPLPRTDDDTAAALDALLSSGEGPRTTLAALLDEARARVRRQQGALDELRRGVSRILGDVPVVELPALHPRPRSFEALLPLADALAALEGR